MQNIENENTFPQNPKIFSDFFLMGRGSNFQSLSFVKNTLKFNPENMQPYKFYWKGYKIPLRVTLIYESVICIKSFEHFYAKLQTFRKSQKQT